MVTDKKLRALFGIITFIFLCFLGIKIDFIQSILTFASVSLVIITTVLQFYTILIFLLNCRATQNTNAAIQ